MMKKIDNGDNKMCIDYGNILTSGILDLQVLREKALNTKVINAGLLCSCKKKILNDYIICSGNLMTMLIGLSQIVGYISDLDRLDYYFKLMKQMFRCEAFNSLYSDQTITSRMTFLYEVMQVQIEDFIFIELKELFIPYINSMKCDINQKDLGLVSVKKCVEMCEMAALHLSGLRINCLKISDDIFRNGIFSVLPKECQKDPNHSQLDGYCTKSDNPAECLHLFLHPTLYKVNSWLKNYFELYKKYHRDTRNISIVLDFKLMPKLIWNKDFEKLNDYLKEVFGEIYFLNCDNVDFGDFDSPDKLIIGINELPQCLLNVTPC